MDSYTAIYRKGCTPPDSVTWDGYEKRAIEGNLVVLLDPSAQVSVPTRPSVEQLARLDRRASPPAA